MTTPHQRASSTSHLCVHFFGSFHSPSAPQACVIQWLSLFDGALTKSSVLVAPVQQHNPLHYVTINWWKCSVDDVGTVCNCFRVIWFQGSVPLVTFVCVLCNGRSLHKKKAQFHKKAERDTDRFRSKCWCSTESFQDQTKSLFLFFFTARKTRAVVVRH